MKRGNYKTLSREKLLVAAIVVATTIGCTKERPYQGIFKDQTSQTKPESKSTVDTQAEYLYVPSSLNSTRTTDATFPMYMGETKIVKLQFDEDVLKVIEMDPEDRFSSNPVNTKPVLSIPVSHIDYKCTKDADGKCTNKEEEDNDKTWSQKRFFKVQADKLAVQEVSFLPVEISNLFYPCYQEIGSSFGQFNLEKDAINVEVEKTYKTRIECAAKLKSMSDLTFKVVYHYSLVKLNSVTTPNYAPLSYSRTDESTFGYFDTHTLQLDRDNVGRENGEKIYLNRWNPSRNVVYHLTENFNKPENAKLKAATYKAVENINATLAKAGATLRIELQDASTNSDPGDIRQNSIVMVEDPVNYGILGYGPVAANPRTGEIVHGRTVMYLGVMKEGIKRAYDDLVAEKTSQIAKARATASAQSAGSGPMRLAPELAKYTGSRASININTFASTQNTVNTPAAFSIAATARSDIKIPSTPVSLKNLKSSALRLEKRLLTFQDVVNMKDNAKIREAVMSRHCFMDLEHFNVNDAIEDEIDVVLNEVGMKPWNDLSDGEKDKVLDTLLPFVWVPTLIHEMGHNLGLRHNFAGSEDKDNFYSADELKNMGIRRQFNYSSVMDYSYKNTNELQIMGKYDVAAFRYGYAEKVELTDGSLVSLSDFRAKPGLELKPYKYCTDENVDVNPNCKRFDEGTSLVEMAQHWTRMYEEMYARRGFRNSLRDFSLYDDDVQIQRVGGIMGNLRSIFERYETIKKTFNLADDAQEWDQYDFLKDLKAASRIAGNFFISVLQTPDTMCAVASASDPNTILGVLSLRQLSPYAISCFDQGNVQINPAFTVVGEAGKSFQSRKDPNSDNPYADQIDVRGTWIDKLLAANALTQRLTGVELYDEYTDNFLDLSDMREKVQSALSDVFLDQVVADVPIYTTTGQTLVAQLPIRMYEKEDSLNGYRILKPLNPSVQAEFGISDSGSNLQTELVKILKRNLPSVEQNNSGDSLLNSIAVNINLPTGVSAKGYVTTNIGLTKYFVNIQSLVAATEVASSEVIAALNRLGEEDVKKIQALIADKKPLPQKASADEKLAYKMGADVLQKFLDGGFQDKSFYEQMLQAMASL